MDIKNYISSGIIELYVMGLCSPEEERELEALRREYPELHKAIISYEEELEANMLKNSTHPPKEVDEKILRTLQSLQAPVVSINANKSSSPVRKMNWLRAVAAAAVLLLGISAFYNYTLFQKNKKLADVVTKSSSTLPEGDYKIFTDPAITPVAMYGVGTHAICRCTMFWDKRTGKAYIMIHHLVRTSAEKNYQLWAEVDGKPVSIGVIDDKVRGRFIEVSNVPSGAVAFNVTLEKAGGATTPTVEETYLSGRI
jgi:anti-sigma-K factor RskA